jgi:hypothetical protein
MSEQNKGMLNIVNIFVFIIKSIYNNIYKYIYYIYIILIFIIYIFIDQDDAACKLFIGNINYQVIMN